MAINRENIKLYLSERFTDEGDGGRLLTGSVVIDGKVNIYQDISRIARTEGASIEAQQVLPLAALSDGHYNTENIQLISIASDE